MVRFSRAMPGEQWEGAMMTEPSGDNLGSDGQEPVQELEVLIGRFVDGEATNDDVDRLTGLVGPRDEFALRALLQHKRDQSMLRRAVEDELSQANCIELPLSRSTGMAFPALARRSLGYLGWAAAIFLALFVGLSEFGEPATARVIRQDQIEQHLVGERELSLRLEPMLKHTEELPDGRFLITIIERRARQLYLDQLDDAWIEEADPTEFDGPRHTDS